MKKLPSHPANTHSNTLFKVAEQQVSDELNKGGKRGVFTRHMRASLNYRIVSEHP